MATFSNMQINGANPSTVGGTGITAKYFPAPSGNFTSGVSTTPSSTNATGQIAVHGDNESNGQLLYVTASGNFEVGPGGACPSVTIDIQANTGTLVSPTYTTIATTGAITAQANLNTFYPWFLQAILVGDTASGTISGNYYGSVDNNNVALTALTNVLSGLDFTGTTSKIIGTVFGLVARITFSVSEPGNKANMFGFAVSGD
jgi:hypothetical protein